MTNFGTKEFYFFFGREITEKPFKHKYNTNENNTFRVDYINKLFVYTV